MFSPGATQDLSILRGIAAAPDLVPTRCNRWQFFGAPQAALQAEDLPLELLLDINFFTTSRTKVVGQWPLNKLPCHQSCHDSCRLSSEHRVVAAGRPSSKLSHLRSAFRLRSLRYVTKSKLTVDVLAKARQAERGTSDGQPEQRLLILISTSDLIG
jgi:hypothetical protein